MNSYPDLSNVAPADRLLFDTGFAAALIHRAAQALQEIAQCGDYPVEVDELLKAIEEFEAGRLQVRSELYENAATATEKGSKNANYIK
jgi:hypothetical protein